MNKIRNLSKIILTLSLLFPASNMNAAFKFNKKRALILSTMVIAGAAVVYSQISRPDMSEALVVCNPENTKTLGNFLLNIPEFLFRPVPNHSFLSLGIRVVASTSLFVGYKALKKHRLQKKFMNPRGGDKFQQELKGWFEKTEELNASQQPSDDGLQKEDKLQQEINDWVVEKREDLETSQQPDDAQQPSDDGLQEKDGFEIYNGGF